MKIIQKKLQVSVHIMNTGMYHFTQ